MYSSSSSVEGEWDDGFFRQRQKREQDIKEEQLNLDLKEAYQLLDLASNADETALRKAHRKLMKESKKVPRWRAASRTHAGLRKT